MRAHDYLGFPLIEAFVRLMAQANAKDSSVAALFDKVTNQLAKVGNNIRCPSPTGGCFSRGTLVHTRDGLKPIEHIRVGDYVLSSPEDGSGTPGYKRVVKTFVHAERTIRKVATHGPQSDIQYFVSATGNHPFWVEGVGWTRADELEKGTVLWCAHGTKTKVASQWPIFRTDEPGVGWVQAWGDLENAYGHRFDYARFQPATERPGPAYLFLDVYESDDPHLRVTVYNIEVEDYHTYYVGDDGIWVHNVNCAGGKLVNVTLSDKMPNSVLQRNLNYRGRPVLAMDGVLAGPQWASWPPAELDR